MTVTEGVSAIPQTHPFSFHDQKAVVVAGTAGIGLAVAQLFAVLGGEVVVASHTKERVHAAVQSIGSAATGEVVDATQEKEVKALFERVGQFDHLIISSGRGIDGPFLEASLEQLQEPWRIKYWSQVLAAKYGASHIRHGGSITLFSGGNATKPGRNTTQAAAINGAIEALGRALAGDFAPLGIRVNVISPGAVWTPLWEKFEPDAAKREERKAAIAAKLPAGTVGTPEELARVIVSYISAPFATGEVFHVNGGAFLV